MNENSEATETVAMQENNSEGLNEQEMRTYSMPNGNGGQTPFMAQQFCIQNIESILPKFGGAQGENFEMFMINFENVAKYYKWPREARIMWFQSRLVRDAQKFYFKLLEIEGQLNYEEIIQRFREFFGAVEKKLQANDIWEIRREQDESFVSLKYRINECVKKYFKNKVDVNSVDGKSAVDSLALSAFLRAIDSRYRERILRENISSFDEAVANAMREERLMGELQKLESHEGMTEKVDKIRSDFQRDISADNDERLKRIEDSMNALKIATQEYRRPAISKITCYYCNKMGHRKDECRIRIRDYEQRNIGYDARNSGFNRHKGIGVGKKYNWVNKDQYANNKGYRERDLQGADKQNLKQDSKKNHFL